MRVAGTIGELYRDSGCPFRECVPVGLLCSPSPQRLHNTVCSAKCYCKYKNFTFGILKNEKLYILYQEVHPRNLVAH